MAYTRTNFKTKKELKAAVKDGTQVYVFQPNDMSGDGTCRDGTCYLEGPHYPKPHTWYATAKIENGIIVTIK